MFCGHCKAQTIPPVNGVMWLNKGEAAPWGGYLLNKEAGARQVAKIKLLEDRLKLAVDELQVIGEVSEKAARELKRCDEHVELLTNNLEAQEPFEAGLVWGIAGLGIGIIGGAVVGALIAR
jgi:hypothetical protein